MDRSWADLVVGVVVLEVDAGNDITSTSLLVHWLAGSESEAKRSETERNGAKRSEAICIACGERMAMQGTGTGLGLTRPRAIAHNCGHGHGTWTSCNELDVWCAYMHAGRDPSIHRLLIFRILLPVGPLSQSCSARHFWVHRRELEHNRKPLD